MTAAVTAPRWQTQLRERVRPVTRRVPGGHHLSEALVYARLNLPWLEVPRERFVIFAQGRSGSTLLADLANASPAVTCDDEILAAHRRFPAVYAHAWSLGRGPVYGFKVKLYQLTDDQQVDAGAFLREVHAGGWQIVHLRRRNIVRQALSSMVAAERGRYHHRVGDGAPRLERVVLDPVELVRRVAEREHFQELERDALEGVPHLPFVYEDDLLHAGRHQQTADRLLTFLGLDPVPVVTRLVKLSERPLSEAIANHSEVWAELAGTPWASLLDSP